MPLKTSNAAKTRVRSVRSSRAATKATPDERALASNFQVSSSDHIVREVLRGLYEGRFVPGQKLTESELTKRFGVGRGSIREALKRLAAEGVVSLSLNRGANIRALSRRDARDIFEVIQALAPLAARLAAERLSAPEDIAALQEALLTLTKAVERKNSFECGRLRNRFYRQLAQISGNQELARVMPNVQVHLIRVQFRAAYGADAEDRVIADYRKVTEAILAKEGADAERAMRDHIRAAARSIEMLPDEAFAFSRF